MITLSSHTKKDHPQAAPQHHHHDQRRYATAPSSNGASVNNGLFRSRLQPSAKPDGAGEQWWEVVDDETAQAAAEDMVLQLERTGLPRLTRLLDRQGMLAAIREHDLGDIRGDGWTRYFLEAEATLLADQGPSAALDAVLSAATTHWSDPWTDREQLLHAWILTRASNHA